MSFFKALKPVLRDFLSTIVFVSIILVLGDVLMATAFGIAAGVVQTGWMLFRRRPVGPLQWLSLGLVALLGTTTLVTHNGFFFKLKSSIIALVLGWVALRPRWIMLYLPPVITTTLDIDTIGRAARAWAVLMGVLALLNLVVAVSCSDREWALFIFVVPATSYLALISVQYGIYRKRILAGLVHRQAE
jgi:intracellular septation protein